MADADLGLFAVIDGMGGHSSGEVASRSIATSLTTFVRQTTNDPDKTWPFPLDPELSFAANRLQVAIRYANRELRTLQHSDTADGQPGATISAILLANDHVVCANVGDCRAYLLRNGSASQVTRDHSLVAEQVQAGLLDVDQARRHPLRHVVTRAVSGNADLVVDMWEVQLEPNDRVLLCSDGVHGLVSDDELGTIASSDHEDLEQVCHQIIAEANRKGGIDNSTVVLIRV